MLKPIATQVKTPMMFNVRNAGKTLVTKSQGMKLSTDGLKGRVLEANLADLNNDDEQAYSRHAHHSREGISMSF